MHIPPGVDTGTRLRLRGEGEAGTHGAPPGDLYLEVCVAPHPIFTRKHQDLYYRAQISFVEAALGTEVEVPTLTASTRLAIPPGTQPGATLRLPGLGLPGLRGKSPGDLVVVVDLQTPTQLSEQQKQLLQEFLSLKGYRGIGRVQGAGSLKGISRTWPSQKLTSRPVICSIILGGKTDSGKLLPSFCDGKNPLEYTERRRPPYAVRTAAPA